MQTVYRARSHADACNARTVLAGIGISSHIADKELWELAGTRRDADIIRVLVDNRRLDQARRALRDWMRARFEPLQFDTAEATAAALASVGVLA
jgi:hypothetical protein